MKKVLQNASLGAFCNTFDLHYAIISFENFLVFFLSGRLRQVLLYIINKNFWHPIDGNTITCNMYQKNWEGHTTVQHMSQTKHNLPQWDWDHLHDIQLHRHTTGNRPGYQQRLQYSGKCWGDSMRLWLSIRMTKIENKQALNVSD